MLSRELARTWRRWIRTPRPVVNFRMGRITAPTYQLEEDLDHLVSHVYELASRFMAGRELDYQRLASKEQGEVAQMLINLEQLTIDEDERDKLKSYLNDLSLILAELTKA